MSSNPENKESLLSELVMLHDLPTSSFYEDATFGEHLHPFEDIPLQYEWATTVQQLHNSEYIFPGSLIDCRPLKPKHQGYGRNGKKKCRHCRTRRKEVVSR